MTKVGKFGFSMQFVFLFIQIVDLLIILNDSNNCFKHDICFYLFSILIDDLSYVRLIKSIRRVTVLLAGITSVAVSAFILISMPLTTDLGAFLKNMTEVVMLLEHITKTIKNMSCEHFQKSSA